MSPRAFAAVAASALIVVAAFLLLTSVTATTQAGGTAPCGSALSPSNDDGRKLSDSADVGNGLNQLAGTGIYRPNQYAGFQAACADAVSTRSTWGWVVGGVGVVALAGALLVSTTGRREPDQSAETDAP